MAFQRWGYKWSDVDDFTPIAPIGDALFGQAIQATTIWETASRTRVAYEAPEGEVVELAGSIVYKRGASMVRLSSCRSTTQP